MSFSLRSLLVVASLACAACQVSAVAQTPTPNVIANRPVPGSALVSLEGTDDLEHCSETSGLKPFCVTNAKTAIEAGLNSMLPMFLTGGEPRYTGTFRYVELKWDYASAVGANVAPAVRLSLVWQFILTDASGKRVVQIAETTIGQPFAHTGQAGSAYKALLSGVLERIGAHINQATAAPDENPTE